MKDENAKTLLRRWMKLWEETDLVYIRFLKRWNLSLNSFWVVEYLERNPEGVEPAELADAVHVMRQLITIILNDLEGRGYILRRESPTDRRRRKILLTETGRAFAKAVCEASAALDLESMQTFTPEEQRQVVEYSQRFCDALKRAVDGAQIPAGQ